MLLNHLFTSNRLDRDLNRLAEGRHGLHGDRAPILAGMAKRNPGGQFAFGNGVFESHQMLSEVDWYERTRLTGVLEQNKGRWIHFTNIPKLGVNPRSVWAENGPYGVYFYPVDFLLKRPDRARDGNQYGTNLPYYFIADLDLSSGINLQKITMDEVRALAERNGWAQWFRPEDMIGGQPGAYMWRVLRNLHEANTISWNAALKGVNFVIDEDKVMYGHLEPEQIVVMNPRIIKNVTMGRNDNVGHKAVSGDERTFQAWLPAYKKVIDRLKAKYGGVLRWQEDKELLAYNKPKAKVRHRAPSLPSLAFKIDDKAFTITAFERRMGDHGFRFSYRFGREQASDQIVTAHEMRNLSLDQVFEKIDTLIQSYAAHDQDLRFTPLANEEQSKQIIDTVLGQGDFQIETEISNDPDHGQVTHHGTMEKPFDDITVETMILLRVNEKSMNCGIDIKINGRNVGYASTYDGDTNAKELAKRLADELEERVRTYERLFKFRDHEQWSAFLGFLALNGGLSLNGELRRRFEPEIAAYESIEDKDGFHYAIKLALASRY